MKYFKIMAVKSFLVLLGVFAMSACNNSLDDLKGPPTVETVVDYTPTGSTNDIFPVGVEAKNKWSVEVIFNSGVPMGLANISNFSISGGSAVIESVFPADTSNRITIYLSNQSPTETYTIAVKTTNIIEEEHIFSTNMDDTNQMSTTNLTRVEGDSYSFEGYGHDDQTPPILEIFYPTTKVDINQALNERLAVYGFAYDEIELSKIEYKIDNGNYVKLNVVSFIRDVNDIAVGDHIAIIRATDLRGNTTAKAVEFYIYRNIPDFALISPQSPTVFIPGNSIEVKTTSSDSNIDAENIRIETPTTNYDYTAMYSVDGFEWTYDFIPDWTDSGECLFIAMMIYTNNAGVYFTNFTSNTVTLYNNTVYLSGSGNDSDDGTRLNPVKTIGRAISLGASLGIQNIKTGAYSFGSYNFTANNITIDGGYSSDFLTHEPDVFRTVFNSITINDRQNITVQNVYIENGSFGVSIDHSTMVTVSNCDISSRGRGLSGNYSRVYVKNCNIYNCSAVVGAGIFFRASIRGEIKNNNISYNIASYDGGGLCFWHSESPIISNNIIFGNTANDFSGGISILYSTSPVIVKNTIENNTAESYGGGLSILFTSSIVIKENTIINNNSVYGGGISFREKSIGTINKNIIMNNSVSHFGGGISFYKNCSGTISENIITANSATENGGGIYFQINCSGTISENDIIDNVANNGGGIFMQDSCSPYISENIINSNTVNRFGAGIYSRNNCSPMINNNIITGNYANSYGGAMYLRDNSSSFIDENIISGNTAYWEGGGLCIENNCSPTINNNTINNNIASCGGGIALLHNSSPTINNNIIISNKSVYGGITLWLDCSPTITGGEISYNSQYGIYRWENTCNPSISGVTHTGNTLGFKNW